MSRIGNPIPCIPFPLPRGRGGFFLKRDFVPLKLPMRLLNNLVKALDG